MSHLGVTSPLRSLMVLGEDPSQRLPAYAYYLNSVNAMLGIALA